MRLAQRLCDDMHGDLQEISAPTYQRPILGFMRAGYDSLTQRRLPAAQPEPAIGGYARIVFCGPVWTSYPAAPLRAFMQSQQQWPETIGLFLTSGSHSPAEKAFELAQIDLGQPIDVMRSLPNSAENTTDEDRIIAEFSAALEKAERS